MKVKIELTAAEAKLIEAMRKSNSKPSWVAAVIHLRLEEWVAESLEKGNKQLAMHHKNDSIFWAEVADEIWKME